MNLTYAMAIENMEQDERDELDATLGLDEAPRRARSEDMLGMGEVVIA